MPPNILRIRDGRTAFAGHPILSGKIGARLATEEYQRAARDLDRWGAGLGISREDFLELGGVMRPIAGLLQSIRGTERGREEELQRLAVKTVAEAYGLDAGHLEMLVGEKRFVGMGEMGFVGDDRDPEPSGEPSEKVKKLIAKRRTHNAIIHGTGLNHMNKALVLARNEVDRIRGGLFEQYMAFVNLAVLTHFHVDLDALPSMIVPRAGRVRLEWGEGNVKIHASAESFPVMVQEISKGVAEVNMAHGLPREGELTAEEQRQFAFHADNEFDEPYYFMMGPSLASRLQKMLVDNDLIVQYDDTCNLGVDLAYTRTWLAMLPEKELHELLRGLLSV